MKTPLIVVASLVVGVPALATPPAPDVPGPAPCETPDGDRTHWPQGTLLWGTGVLVKDQEKSSVLASVELAGARLGGEALADLRLEGGRLVAPAASPGLVGTVLLGAASDGKPVHVALCGTEPSREDPSQVWYQVKVWKKDSKQWVNPCLSTHLVPSPRMLAVPGVWGESGARRAVDGKFTFACETGVIAKCVSWGYNPWGEKDGRALTELHQACTRMARADYCGDGRSHTHENNTIDMYDVLRVQTRAMTASASWDPKRASFEAAWTPEGAACLARTRDGRAVEEVMASCPGRFEPRAKDLGEGDRCKVLRKGGGTGTVLLRNHSYDSGKQAAFSSVAP